MSELGTGRDEQALSQAKQRTRRPRRWKVLLYNDDYTTMEFVVQVLVSHFQKSQAEATHIMLQVHRKGTGVAGVYPRDQADTKVVVVTEEARLNGMPLKLTTEPE